ncbi:hypothetical protein D623_10019764 [Myotis brandtii]|uniref:Uncharacterized protein n=1 Tax=Myotis brandtii TaxID=109478 RepID=S7QCS1_MYOBR|nr:hypothetical protein D623_10019764 [Myotis brandtii]
MGSSEAVTTQSKCLSPSLRGAHPHSIYGHSPHAGSFTFCSQWKAVQTLARIPSHHQSTTKSR